MPHIRSSGIEDPQDSIYGCGACHIHAIAAARHHGGTRFLIVEDHDEVQWSNTYDEDDYVPAVVHVYSLHDVQGHRIARDILGDRLAEHAASEAEDLFGIGNMASWEASLEELLSLTQGKEIDQMLQDGAENPLARVTEGHILDAMAEASVLVSIPLPGERASNDTEFYKALSLAVRIAARAHAEQTRKGGESFILHPIRVSKMVRTHGGDADTVIAAVLHDVVEDSPRSLEEISALFGERVAELVEGCTNSAEFEAMSSAERKAAQAEKYAGAEPDVQLIKLADQTDNLESLRDAITERNHKWVARYAQGALAVAKACRTTSDTLYARAEAAYEAVEQALTGEVASSMDIS